MAVRYPRSVGLGVKMDTEFRELPIGRSEVLRQGKDVAILAIGSMVAPSMEAADILAKSGIEATVVNVRFVKPIDSELVTDLAAHIKNIVTVEENTLSGGFGSYVLSALKNTDVKDVKVKTIGLPDVFVEHGRQDFLRSMYGLDAKGIVKTILTMLPVTTAQ
jgi:1-deoxy-D-xylulose-5-phosphate synthase